MTDDNRPDPLAYLPTIEREWNYEWVKDMKRTKSWFIHLYYHDVERFNELYSEYCPIKWRRCFFRHPEEEEKLLKEFDKERLEDKDMDTEHWWRGKLFQMHREEYSDMVSEARTYAEVAKLDWETIRRRAYSR